MFLQIVLHFTSQKSCHFIVILISSVGFYACANIKRVPKYKETDSDVRFANNYLDNQVCVPALLYYITRKSCFLAVVVVHTYKYIIHLYNINFIVLSRRSCEEMFIFKCLLFKDLAIKLLSTINAHFSQITNM